MVASGGVNLDKLFGFAPFPQLIGKGTTTRRLPADVIGTNLAARTGKGAAMGDVGKILGNSGVTRRRVVGWGAVGGLATIMAPMPLRFGVAASNPYKIGSIQPLSGAGAAVGKTALVGLQMAVDRINKSGGHPRPRGSADRRRRRVEARCRPPQNREIARRRPGRRQCRRRFVEHLPRLHAALSAAQGHQHDQRLPRHDDHQQQVQPLQLPPLRLRPGPGGRLRAISRQQDRQEMAHRLCRLRLGPIDPRCVCRRRSRSRAARLSAAPASRSAPPT